jgi:hypothetical protein
MWEICSASAARNKNGVGLFNFTCSLVTSIATFSNVLSDKSIDHITPVVCLTISLLLDLLFSGPLSNPTNRAESKPPFKFMRIPPTDAPIAGPGVTGNELFCRFPHCGKDN